MSTKTEIKYIIQVVQNLPPSICGLGDYACRLASQLRKDHGIETIFIVSNPDWKGGQAHDGFNIIKLTSRSSRCLAKTVTNMYEAYPDVSMGILLHYAGYAYDKHGYPYWLVMGLRRLKKSSMGLRLHTYFHELYPPTPFQGPPWRSTFWFSEFQKRIVLEILRLSDQAITSRGGYRDMLYSLSCGESRHIIVLPVFSNIGECEPILPINMRKPQLIIFGNRWTKYKAYNTYQSELISSCKILGINEILDIGVPSGFGKEKVGGARVMELGVLNIEDIKKIMVEAQAGFIANPSPDYFAKSGIFASYCACGLLPVVPRAATLPQDGLKPDDHYWVVRDGINNLKVGFSQTISTSANRWYLDHNLKVHSDTFYKLQAQY